jgi:hypothetical protein
LPKQGSTKSNCYLNIIVILNILLITKHVESKKLQRKGQVFRADRGRDRGRNTEIEEGMGREIEGRTP